MKLIASTEAFKAQLMFQRVLQYITKITRVASSCIGNHFRNLPRSSFMWPHYLSPALFTSNLQINERVLSIAGSLRVRFEEIQ